MAVPSRNAVVIFESLTGNTRKAARLIASALNTAGVATTVCPITKLDYQALEVADLVIVGAWTDGVIIAGQRPGRGHRLRRLPAMGGKRCLVYCTYAIDPGKTLEKMTRIMEDRGAMVLGGMAIRRNNLEGGAKDFAARLLGAISA